MRDKQLRRWSLCLKFPNEYSMFNQQWNYYAEIPKSWQSPAICTHKTSSSVIPKSRCRVCKADASCPAKWQTLKMNKQYRYVSYILTKLPVGHFFFEVVKNTMKYIHIFVNIGRFESHQSRAAMFRIFGAKIRLENDIVWKSKKYFDQEYFFKTLLYNWQQCLT